MVMNCGLDGEDKFQVLNVRVVAEYIFSILAKPRIGRTGEEVSIRFLL